MSMTDRWGDKVVLERIGPDQFWEDIRAFYAGEETYRWKLLAMLALRVNGCWPLEMIGQAFDMDRGSVSRGLSKLIGDLREHFEWVPELEESELTSEG